MFAAPEVTAHVFRDGGGDEFSYDGYGINRGRGEDYDYYYGDGYDDDDYDGGRYQERAASVSLESSLPGCFASLPKPILESLWKDPGTFGSDFVLVTEFSEVVGPKPVLTVPDGAGGDFDQNHFALRVMSVDYQLGSSIAASSSGGDCDSADGGASCGGGGGGGATPLTMARDSKHLLHDFAQGASAYVHHFTFYDLEARGFVRPYCMSYVTADEHKLLAVYEHLAADFERASECFKQGNRCAFARSVSELLQDLEFTKAELLRRDGPQQQQQRAGSGNEATAPTAAVAPPVLRLPVCTAAAVERSNELGNVERLLFDHRQLLNRVRGAAGAAGDAVPMADGGPAYTPKYYRQRSCKGAEKTLKSMRELCGSQHFERGVELLSELQRRYRADTAQLAFVHSELWSHAFATSDCERLFPELGTGKPEEEQPREFDSANHNNGAVAKDCIDSWHRSSSGVAACSLESYASCVESVPIGVVQGASTTLATPPHPSPPLLHLTQTEGVGSAGSGDSIEVLRTEWPQNTGVVAAAATEEEDEQRQEAEEQGQDEGGEEEVAALAPGSDPGGPDWAPRLCELRRSHSVHRNVSEDSIEVLGSTAFASPCGMEAPPDSIAEETVCETSAGGSDEPSSLVFYSVDGYIDDGGGGGGGVNDDDNNNGNISTHTEEAENEQLGWCPNAGIEGGNELRIHGMEPLNGEDLSLSLQDRFSESSSSHLSRGLETPAPAADGFDALQLARRLDKQTTHVLFALLSGRTLAVLAEGEMQARRSIDALLPFVPAGGADPVRGCSRPLVEPWRTDALRISDIAAVKLVGMKSSQVVHDALLRYRRYVSVLDTASGTLTTPAYEGTLLTNLSGQHTRSLAGNRAYLARAGAILAKLSSKAFVLQSHLRGLCCSRDGGAIEDGATAEDKTEALPRDAIVKWCDSCLDLLPDDAHIVRHLAELMTERAMGQRVCQPALRVNYVSSSTFRFQPFRSTDMLVDS